MNTLCFTGNLGRDCSTNNVSGTAVVNFAVAMKSGFGDKEQTVWVDCALWGKKAEGRLPEFLTKGQQVAVSGELGTREYQANDGTMKTVITCRVNDVSLIGSKQDGQQPPQPQYQQPQQPAPMQPQYGQPQGQPPAPQRQAPPQQAPMQQPPHQGFTDQGEEIPF